MLTVISLKGMQSSSSHVRFGAKNQKKYRTYRLQVSGQLFATSLLRGRRRRLDLLRFQDLLDNFLLLQEKRTNDSTWHRSRTMLV